ncbi:uncharacterized protein LOC123552153 [Mercenaria mercenaria]|uniref:uncharacterized protein LOC123552153 n=1 Tax=Mercenaria mercenaria TaxID=6596 RepID=UPI00234F57B9|nr:uncharacterized protein LOC123552153 [Mercenaria mercenaria]
MTFSPVTSQLLNRYSYSRVMMAGGLFCMLSLIVSSFVSSVVLLYLTFSVFYGIGTCMCTAPTMTITPEYFDKYMSIATGITVSGSSFGTLIMGPLSQIIIEKAGWRAAFRIYAGFIVITIILNSQIKAPPTIAKRKAEGRSFIKDLQIWKSRVFVIWTIAITLVMFGFYIPYVHLVSYAVDRGISPDTASLLMMILGATTAIGRIMFGKIVQLGILNRLHMHQLSMVVTGTGVMVLPLITSYTGIVLYVITVGLVDGCFVVLLPIMTASLIGIEKSVVAWGFLIGTCSVTFTLGPPVAGALYDATGSYNVAFHCAGIPIVAGAVLLFLIPWAQRTSRGTNALSALTEITLQASSQDGPSGVYRTDSTGTICAEEKLVNSVHIGSMSNAAVQTMVSSSIIMSYADKSTSTEDVSIHQISLDVADALSQLSYTSRVFDDTLLRSLSSGQSHHGGSTSSNEIPKIPPPSEPVSFQRKADNRTETKGSSVHSISSQLSSQSGQTNEQGPLQISIASDSVKSGQSSTHPLTGSIPSEHGALGTTATSGSIHSEHSLFKPTAISSQSAHTESADVSISSASQLFALPIDPLQPTRLKQPSPKQGSVSSSQSIVGGDLSKQSSNFDQTISDQVNMLRDTLKSPTPCSSKMEEAGKTVSSFIGSRPTSPYISGQANVSTSGNITSPCSNKSGAKSEHSNPFLQPEPGPSRSEASRLIQEAMQADDTKLGGDSKQSSETDTQLGNNEFDHDNQLTVIPATNRFASKKSSQSGSKLEELFKPITEEENIQKKLSYEVVNTDSGDQVQQTQSQTGELDVFTHLFQDDEA